MKLRAISGIPADQAVVPFRVSSLLRLGHGRLSIAAWHMPCFAWDRTEAYSGIGLWYF